MQVFELKTITIKKEDSYNCTYKATEGTIFATVSTKARGYGNCEIVKY
jgi:hypothetical protein